MKPRETPQNLAMPAQYQRETIAKPCDTTAKPPRNHTFCTWCTGYPIDIPKINVAYVRPGLRARQCPTVRQRPTASDSVRQRPTASDSVRQQITCSHATNCPTGSDRVRQGPTVPTADSPTVSDNVRQSDTRVRQFRQFRQPGLKCACASCYVQLAMCILLYASCYVHLVVHLMILVFLLVLSDVLSAIPGGYRKGPQLRPPPRLRH